MTTDKVQKAFSHKGVRQNYAHGYVRVVSKPPLSLVLHLFFETKNINKNSLSRSRRRQPGKQLETKNIIISVTSNKKHVRQFRGVWLNEHNSISQQVAATETAAPGTTAEVMTSPFSEAAGGRSVMLCRAQRVE